MKWSTVNRVRKIFNAAASVFAALTFCTYAHADEIKIGIIDSFNPGLFSETLSPTLDYLNQKLPQHQFKFVPVNSINPAEDLKRQDVSFFICSAGTFHELSLLQGAMHIATRKTVLSEDPSASEASTFVTLADRKDLDSLASLKGKTVVASQPNSFDGWLIALHEIHKLGFNPDNFFSKALFSHFQFPDALMALVERKADVAILSACLLEKMADEGLLDLSEFKVVAPKSNTTLHCAHSTDLYPGIVFASVEQTSPKLAWEVTSALISIGATNDYEWTIANRFSKVSDLYRDLQIGPYAYLKDWSLNGVISRFGTEIGVAALLLLMLIGNWFYLRRTVAKRTAQVKRTLERQIQLEKEQRESRLRLAQLEKFGVISQMSGMLAHECQQPLMAINNYLAGLKYHLQKEGHSDALTAKAISNLESNSERIGDIIIRVRNYAKRKRGTLKRCDLTQIAESALTVLASGQYKNIPIKYQGPQHAYVSGEPLELELLMINLMRNACSAAESQSQPAVSLTITDADTDHFCIEVEDNGPALDDAGFARLKSLGDSIKPNGMGIGLSLVRGIADSHGGTLEFSRLQPNGISAKFTIEKDKGNEAPAG